MTLETWNLLAQENLIWKKQIHFRFNIIPVISSPLTCHLRSTPPLSRPFTSFDTEWPTERVWLSKMGLNNHSFSLFHRHPSVASLLVCLFAVNLTASFLVQHQVPSIHNYTRCAYHPGSLILHLVYHIFESTWRIKNNHNFHKFVHNFNNLLLLCDMEITWASRQRQTQKRLRTSRVVDSLVFVPPIPTTEDFAPPSGAPQFSRQRTKETPSVVRGWKEIWSRTARTT